MSKKLLLTFLTLGVVVSLTAFGVNSINADDDAYSPVITKIAERFNLNEEDVEAVFDAVQDEKQEQMRIMREERLSDAVSDGVITEEQKAALMDKWEEMHEERMRRKEEMRAWFDEQGIDHTALAKYLGKGGYGGFGFGHHRGR